MTRTIVNQVLFVKKVNIPNCWDCRKSKSAYLCRMMNFAGHNQIKKIFACLIIALMGLLIVNKVIFLHSHILTDGTVITHAHPYQTTDDSKPFKSHHHTQAAFFFFGNIQLLFCSASVALFIFILHNKITLAVSGLTPYSCYYSSILKNRAPPAGF